MKRLTTVLAGFLFLFYTGGKDVMKTSIGNEIIYPMILCSIIFTLISLSLEEKKEKISLVGIFLAVIGMILYLAMWGAKYWLEIW